VTGDRGRLTGPEDPPAAPGRPAGAGAPTWRPHRWQARESSTRGCCSCGWGNPPRVRWAHINTWRREHIKAEAARHGLTVAEVHERSKVRRCSPRLPPRPRKERS
jgi:hypothetical protein